MSLSGYRALARKALRGALTIRSRIGVTPERAVCVYDLAQRLGVEVRFSAGSTLGGMYARGPNVIVVPAERPPGRQAFTCAHELGHWYFDHGTRVDELLDIDDAGEADPQELLVNMFAGYLLMPSKAVEAAFHRRRWIPATATPLQVYLVAGQLGVGYETLIHHLRWSLDALSEGCFKVLLKTTPKDIRRGIFAEDTPRLVLVDEAWCDVPVDLAVGDAAIVPKGSHVEGGAVRVSGVSDLGVVLIGSVPGLARVESESGSWCSFVRVSRRNFIGRAIYRHLEDPDAEPA